MYMANANILHLGPNADIKMLRHPSLHSNDILEGY